MTAQLYLECYNATPTVSWSLWDLSLVQVRCGDRVAMDPHRLKFADMGRRREVFQHDAGLRLPAGNTMDEAANR